MSQKAQNILNSRFEIIRQSLDAGEISSAELTEESLRRARLSQAWINSLISISEDTALAEAEAADRRLKSGERGGILGIPVALKDLILAKGTKTTAASKMLSQFIAPYDATVAKKIKVAGAPVIGKTNLDEFAMGSSNETSHFGPVKNPWDYERVSGGSSGGSAALVAGRIAPLSLGTDTGGSIRQPSAFCGITGIKPTYGRVSRYGVVAYASSLDQVGPMTIDALSAAAVLEVISGKCTHDATSSSRLVPKFYDESIALRTRANLSGLRVGLPKQYFEVEGLQASVKNAVEKSIEQLKNLGAQIVSVDLPHTKYSLPTYYLIATSEASSNLERYDGIHYGHRSSNFRGGPLEQLYSLSRAEGFGEEVKMRILLGTYALSSGYYDAFYKKASQVRTLIKHDFEQAFAKCDVIAGPTSPTTAFKLGEKLDDSMAMYLADVYTLAINLAGLPSLSLNVGFDSDRLPIGMQLSAPWWQESSLLGMAALFQEQFPETLSLSPLASDLGKSSIVAESGGIRI